MKQNINPLYYEIEKFITELDKNKLLKIAKSLLRININSFRYKKEIAKNTSPEELIITAYNKGYNNALRVIEDVTISIIKDFKDEEIANTQNDITEVRSKVEELEALVPENFFHIIYLETEFGGHYVSYKMPDISFSKFVINAIKTLDIESQRNIKARLSEILLNN